MPDKVPPEEEIFFFLSFRSFLRLQRSAFLVVYLLHLPVIMHHWFSNNAAVYFPSALWPCTFQKEGCLLFRAYDRKCRKFAREKWCSLVIFLNVNKSCPWPRFKRSRSRLMRIINEKKGSKDDEACRMRGLLVKSIIVVLCSVKVEFARPLACSTISLLLLR